MDDRTDLFTIGQLATRTGLSVRTIRFWSDSGVVPPTDRSHGGYRLYDTEAVARLDLVRTLRELGVDLDTVTRVLREQVTLADVARTHVRAIDAEIRTLRLRRAVLTSVARRGSTTEEMRLMNKMARLSAVERQRVIDEFVDETFADLAPDAPGAHIGKAMRALPADLPDEPSAAQVDAWVELAELVADADFRARVREMAVTGAQGEQLVASPDPTRVIEHAGTAVAAGVAPESAQGKEILDRIVSADLPADQREALADQIDRFTDRRVERYWQLMAILNGQEPFPLAAPSMEWFAAALRAHA
ncbi:MerR family transcriptional regulator [Actinokineospora enzanensis]|uniref:helix-turn-helix domain-containing protein n=1 Tax=Actinokineospora enzanensis TaxID=155975 RepID=UPI00037A4311|nr:MerR family transcriptional regulator [Actinokineospora enzanensis]